MEYCVVCGDIIPEGRQVCWICDKRCQKIRYGRQKICCYQHKAYEYKWKFGKLCTLWGHKRTADDEEPCFAGYTENIETAELYSVNEFISKYGSEICNPNPVKMCPDLCKRYKKYDTVLILESDYRRYYDMCKE